VKLVNPSTVDVENSAHFIQEHPDLIAIAISMTDFLQSDHQ
jgi:hypothetical protein